MKTISVIIPIYNVEPYLKKCLDSIIIQTYRDLEIILVDDGSPDNCPAICDEYAQKDARVKVVHKKNGGLSSARNAGMDAATGEYICFFDSDDFIESDMLEKMFRSIEENDNEVCICGYSVDTYNESGVEESQKDVIPPYSNIDQQLSLSEYEYILGLCGYAWNKLYRRQFLQKHNLKFEEGTSLVEDLLFNAAVFGCGARAYFIPYAGYHYIQRKRETLGAKYYENFFELKQRALDAKCDILRKWGVAQELVVQFFDNNLIDAVWGTIKNIQNSSLDSSKKREKAIGFMRKFEIKHQLKKVKPQGCQRKIKRFILRLLSIKLLLKIVEK